MTAPDAANDGDLLRAFRTASDQQAFAELVRRHGGAVVGAAQSVVGHESAAQDVAQATFLTLARKAGLLAKDASVAGWLHHVAVCLARNHRRQELRRAAREKEAVMFAAQLDPSPRPSEAARSALHEELAKLNAPDRAALVLHHLEGLSYEAAAAALGCNPNTFGPRLTRAREKLRQRLVKRGVTLGADGLGGVLEEGATSVALPAAFVAATCQAASLIAAGKTLSGTGLVSAKVAYLTKSALKTLFWAKVKTAAAAIVLTAGVAVGGGVVARQVLAHRVVTPPVPAPAPGGQVWAWGDNQFGQLGDGTTVNRSAPVPVPGLDGVIAISAGNAHMLALKADRTVWAWGANAHGQLGDGTTTDHHTPVPVRLPDGRPLTNIAAVGAGVGVGCEHSLALTTDGRIWAWGDNQFGQLGDGTTTNRLTPVPIPGLVDVTAVVAGNGYTVALRNDQTVWAWGRNGFGQLGDGTTVTRLAAVQAKTAAGAPLAGVIAIAAAAGKAHTVALKNDHTVWTCGYGNFGQLGYDELNASLPYRPVADFSAASSIAAGSYFTLALKDERTVWMWGTYSMSLPTHGPAPVKLPDGALLANVTAIAAGARHAVALLADGTLATWGESTLAAAPVPLPDVTALAKVTAIAAGGSHTAVVVTAR